MHTMVFVPTLLKIVSSIFDFSGQHYLRLQVLFGVHRVEECDLFMYIT